MTSAELPAPSTPSAARTRRDGAQASDVKRSPRAAMLLTLTSCGLFWTVVVAAALKVL